MNGLTISLVNGRGIMTVDPGDFIKMSQHPWVRTSNPSGNIYAQGFIDGRYILAHRYLLGLSSGDPSVDHINHDGLDNRRSNLRVVGQTLNHANRRPSVGFTSRFKGVYWDKTRNRWRAGIRNERKTIHLGAFRNEEEAARVYDKAAVGLWGDHAYTNERAGLYDLEPRPN